MASITTSVVLLRWPLVSAVLMFLASSLNIQLRKSDYAGLAVICSCLGLAAACWFATGLLGITLQEGSRREALRIAGSMLQNGLDKEMVQKITGLSADELQPLCG